MNRFKELLFLKNIKSLGNTRINKDYLILLKEYSDLDDLITQIEYRFNISLENLEKAKEIAEIKYEEIINDDDIEIVTVFDENYPKQLLTMGNKRPLILYAKGDVDILSKQNIAFIGTRKPSKFSEEFEKECVEAILNSSDRVIVSGLALGCDKIAHQTTVDLNKLTVAVLPSGVNVIKPAKHKKLAEEIIQAGGCLISEYEPDKIAYKSTYVERDAIVAALSDVLFVVECGVESGSMHTVRAAEDFEKRIFAYLPEDTSQGSYDGNEFILENIDDSIKVDDIDVFLKELENSNTKKNNSSQPTLDKYF